jgi:GT2 family glycosyltransferase
MSNNSIATSIVICTFTEDRWDDLLAAVESSMRQQPAPGEVVVVVDYNNTLFERLQARFPDILIVKNSYPQGLSGARNTGIAASRGNLIAFLDDDAIAEPDWLLRLQNHCQNPLVLGAGGRVEPHWLGPRPRWFPDEFLWVVGCTYLGSPVTAGPVRNLSGGCMCVRREVFSIVGGYQIGLGRAGNPIPLGCEETEFCIRASQVLRGGVFIFEPSARIHHKIPMKRTTWRYFCSRCYAEGYSKALVSRLLTAKLALTSEWSYTLKILPAAILRALCDSILGRDVSGISRVAAIAVGFAMTFFGYLLGTYRSREQKTTRGLDQNA